MMLMGLERYMAQVNQHESAMGASVGAFSLQLPMCVASRDPEPPGDGFPEKEARAEDPQGQETHPRESIWVLDPAMPEW